MSQNREFNRMTRGRLLSLRGIMGVVAAIAVSAVSVQGGEILKVRQQVAVARNKLYLKDLFKNAENFAGEKADTPVMETPPVGEKKRIALIDLAYKLQRFPELLDSKIRGPDTILIERKVNWEKVSDSIKGVKEAIRQKSPWKEWTIQVDLDRTDRRRISKLQGSSYRVQVAEKDKMLGEVPMHVTALTPSGREKSQQRLTPVIRRRIQGLVLTKRKRRGSNLRASDVKKVELWIKDNRQDISQNIEECVGRELNRTLNEGDMLKKKYLVAPLYAEKGDLVVVDCEHSNLQVRVNVRALESGRKGERVRVRNPESNKIFSVKLTGKRRAKLEF